MDPNDPARYGAPTPNDSNCLSRYVRLGTQTGAPMEDPLHRDALDSHAAHAELDTLRAAIEQLERQLAAALELADSEKATGEISAEALRQLAAELEEIESKSPLV
ncbi:MAG: hypothetical protein JSW68_01665 [Burkholderiales bacterium]|nr:MAG: hypothetical protein JSW68_01665 [Burkholderiales bacterium]